MPLKLSVGAAKLALACRRHVLNGIDSYMLAIPTIFDNMNMGTTKNNYKGIIEIIFTARMAQLRIRYVVTPKYSLQSIVGSAKKSDREDEHHTDFDW